MITSTSPQYSTIAGNGLYSVFKQTRLQGTMILGEAHIIRFLPKLLKHLIEIFRFRFVINGDKFLSIKV